MMEWAEKIGAGGEHLGLVGRRGNFLSGGEWEGNSDYFLNVSSKSREVTQRAWKQETQTLFWLSHQGRPEAKRQKVRISKQKTAKKLSWAWTCYHLEKLWVKSCWQGWGIWRTRLQEDLIEPLRPAHSHWRAEAREWDGIKEKVEGRRDNKSVPTSWGPWHKNINPVKPAMDFPTPTCSPFWICWLWNLLSSLSTFAFIVIPQARIRLIAATQSHLLILFLLIQGLLNRHTDTFKRL